MKVKLENKNSNMVKEVPIGFSWTTLFFGFFPALFRGDVKWALIMFGASAVTFGVSALVFPFIYNKLHIKDLLEKGYTPFDDSCKSVLVANGIEISEPATAVEG